MALMNTDWPPISLLYSFRTPVFPFSTLPELKMMQRTSPLCSSNSFSHSFPCISILNQYTFPCRRRLAFACNCTPSSIVQVPSYHLHNFPISPPSRHRVATSEILDTVEAPSGFVEIGYISNVHGTQGEVRVKPSTDFPELRFSTPGTRWLKQQISGREAIREVELEEGREHPGRKSWILKFVEIDTAEQAKQLIGSTLLVREEDRPELEEDEFYSRDLVGMSVILKENGQSLGTVVNVFDSGGADLLHVMLDRSQDILDTTGNSTLTEIGESGRLVWIPFVEAIVPIVDLHRREMKITPPKGLLELNLHSDERSKKERRQLEWKERKKFQKRLIAAKKKLSEMEQKHIFDGFKFGEKAQGRLLADQIVGVNSKLLQKALQYIESPKRLAVNKLFDASKLEKIQNTLRISDECVTSGANEEELGKYTSLQKKGVDLISSGKTAVVLVVDEEGWYSDIDVVCETAEHPTSSALPALLCDDRRFAKIEDRPYMPLILVCSASSIHSIEKLFKDNDYFAFNPEKLWFLEEERLPVVSNVADELKIYKIFMKSPWEILQSPVGSGGVINLLSSPNILDSLAEMGVEYVKICSSSSHVSAGMNTLLLGYVASCNANIGIQLHKGTNDFEKGFHLIFSMNFIKNLTKQIDKVQFYAIPKSNAHVEKVDKEWIDVSPSSPNSYQLCSSIFSWLDECSFDDICMMEIA